MSDYEENDIDMMEPESESDFGEFGASDDDDDDFFEVVEAPKKKKAAPAAKAPAKKKSTKKAAAKPAALGQNKNVGNVFDVDDDEVEIVDTVAKKPAAAAAGKKKNKTVEETYQKKSQLEHILLRPDTYIGSTEPLSQPMYVLDSEKEKIVERQITYTPGLYKIFDEILVNAADNKQRDPNMSELHIQIDPEANYVSVKNNGKGVPVVMHGEENCYVPTMIFGQLLTGSNFDDDEQKTTGGRNGYGAKLANIFSTEFTVECVDSAKGKKFVQVFRNNMSVAEEPSVTNLTAAEKKKGDYTKISFKPDLTRFKMNRFDQDAVDLLSKRALDIAGSMASRPGKKLAVTLNGKKLPVKSFQDYIKLFEGINQPVAMETYGDNWEVGIAAASEGTSQQISFVNAICTSKGGGHITYIENQMVEHLKKVLKKKNKGEPEVKPAQIKNHLCIFVNCLVVNPTFDSQTKENCTTKPKQFGGECKLSDKFLKQVDKSEIVTNILSYAQYKNKQALKGMGGTKKKRVTGIEKLDDANHAGGPKSKDCTLILTEGDSAKTLAMSGLSIVGRDYYGVFPLKGKPLNVRDATTAAIKKNVELQAIMEIMGLKMGQVYTEDNIKTLRYGQLMIMADQDTDGSHIKGLIINFFHHFWPSLLDIPGFLKQFITPIVKVSKTRNGKDVPVKSFFTIPEYETWVNSVSSLKSYSIKYYKGLGTSTAKEAKEYFSKLSEHEVKFGIMKADTLGLEDLYGENLANVVDVDENGEIAVPDKTVSGSDLIDMVFRKDRVEERKKWLNNVQEDTFMDYKRAQRHGVRYSDFVNNEMSLFSLYDNKRSIPSFVDGFKPSQRKVLFALLKRKIMKKGGEKVSTLSGYIAEHTAYHHGEASLQGTIVGMAQNFVGSNNVNLLVPAGQFGTRRMGGKDAASARYIATKLEPIARTIFHPDDDAILTYLEDDGASVEPEFYVPVIPLVLVNGSEGIGTGWSSNVPNFCPRQVIKNLRCMIQGESVEELYPNYYGFTGDITPAGKEKSFNVEGKIERLDATSLKITELPLKKWTQDYKVFLEKMLEGDSKSPPELKDIKEYHTDTTVDFVITAEESKINEWEKTKGGGLLSKFKLTGVVSTNNMNLFNTAGKISKFDNANEILEKFFEVRTEFYIKRKALLVDKLEKEKKRIHNQARFVQEVCDGDVVVSNRKKIELLGDLKERGYDLIPSDSKKNNSSEAEEAESDSEDAESTVSDAELRKGYDYLLSMQIWTLTYEKVEKLRELLAAKAAELEDLKNTEPSQIWLKDLDAIEAALDDRDKVMAEDEARDLKATTAAAKRQGKKTTAKKAPAKKKKKDAYDSDVEMEEVEPSYSDDEDEVIAVPKTTSRAKKVAAKSKLTAKPAAAKKPAPKKAVAPAAPPQEEEEEKDDVELPLMERLQKGLQKVVVSPAGKSKKARRDSDSSSSSSGSKRPFAVDELDFTDEETEKPVVKKAKKPIAVKKPAAKVASKKKPAFADSESEDDDDDDSSVGVAAKKPAGKAKKPAAKPVAKKKQILADSESEDDFFDGEDSDGSDVEVVAAPAKRSGRERKPITYDIESDTDDSDFE